MHGCAGDLLAGVPAECVVDRYDDRVAWFEASFDHEPYQDESNVVGQPRALREESMEGPDVFPANRVRSANDASDCVPACRERPASHQGHERRQGRRREARREDLKHLHEAGYGEHIRHDRSCVRVGGTSSSQNTITMDTPWLLSLCA